MKKLILLASSLSLSAGVFADPLVYDYKASIKHMYLKEVKVTIDRQPKQIYQKYQKSASLKGYLVVDMDGVTSKRINAASTAQCLDVGRKRAFLVVQNSSAEKIFKFPKCLPAILDAKFLDTGFTKRATTGLAEGYLFVGGDSIAAVRPQLDDLNGTLTVGSALPLPAAGKSGGVTCADYAWQSIYLFGQFSGPNWKGPFPGFEQAWNQNLPEVLRRGEEASAYHDIWLRGSGFGKYEVGKESSDFDPGPFIGKRMLGSLAGNLSGGIFLCAENGIAADQKSAYSFFDQTDDEDYDWSRWDDQFVANRLGKNAAKTWASDAWQNDNWLDGAVDQTTTDSCYGTWSIKINKKFMASGNGACDKFITSQGGADGDKIRAIKVALNPQLEKGKDHPEVVAGGDKLLYAILAAGYALNKQAPEFIDGKEIHSATTESPSMPMLTPKFCTYYGLNNFKDAE